MPAQDESRELLPDWLSESPGDLATIEAEPDFGLPDFGLEFADAIPDRPSDRALAEMYSPDMTPPPREWTAPAKWLVRTGQVSPEADDSPDWTRYSIDVRNDSSSEVAEYRVEFEAPNGAKTVRVNRRPRRNARGVEWDLGLLDPGENARIVVRIPNAEVRDKSPAVVKIASRTGIQTRLGIEAEAASVAFANRRAGVRVRVANRGPTETQPIRVELFGNDPDRPIAVEESPSIAVGETRTIHVNSVPSAGLTRWKIRASSRNARTVSTDLAILGVAADVDFALRIPGAFGLDEEIAGRVVIRNRSPLPLAEIRCSLSIPEQLIFRGATERGTLSVRGDEVEWSIPAIAASAEWHADIKLVGFAPGQMRLVAKVAGAELEELATTAAVACEVRRAAGVATLAELLAAPNFRESVDDSQLDAAVPRDTRIRHLLFRAAGNRFALPIENVLEVLRPLPVTPVPGVPDWLCGVANIRGDIVTVADLAPLLGLEDDGQRNGLVIVRTEGADAFGLLFGDVVGIRPLDSARDVETEGEFGRVLSGITLDDAGVIHILDPVELLAASANGPAAPA